MRARIGRLGGGMLVALLMLASHANADTVTITSGTLVDHPYPEELGSFVLFGNEFSAGGAADAGGFYTFGAGFQAASGPVILTSRGGGFLTSGGSTFVASGPNDIVGTLTLAAGPFSIPAPVAGQTSYSFTAPFTATGMLGTIAGASFDLTGQGTATIAGPVVDNSGFMSYGPNQTEVFAFSNSGTSPTPEPASLLLLGTGLVGLITRRFITA